MTVNCTRARSVCRLIVADKVSADFESDVDEEMGEQPRLVRIPHELFLEMGRPSKITLTIEPGDLLNVEE